MWIPTQYLSVYICIRVSIDSTRDHIVRIFDLQVIFNFLQEEEITKESNLEI